MISIIIPIYQRRANLRLVLKALELQSNQDFEVIIADDGSDDDPLGVISSYAARLPAVRYCWQKHDGFRAAMARNMGTALARGSALLFIDSDILLNRTALEHYANIHKANPTVIIAGQYDWLPPMMVKEADVDIRWQVLVAGALPVPRADEPTVGIVGLDPRAARVENVPYRFDSTKVVWRQYALMLFSGNLLVPTDTYREIGGFDENMVGHGAEDCEFAIRAELASLPVIFSAEVIGYHVYHWRDQARNEFEVRENVEYIRDKHDLLALGIAPGGAGQLPLVYEEI